MGIEIVYCARCACRIAGNDFAKGNAFRREGRAFCAKCVPIEVIEPVEIEAEEVEEKPVPPPPVRASSTRIKAMKPPKRGGTSGVLPRPPRPSPPPPPPRSNKALFIGLGVGGAVLLVGAGIYFLGGSTPAPEPEAPRGALRAPAPAAAPAAAGAPKSPDKEPPPPPYRAAIEAARAKEKSAPDDLDAQIALWEEAARLAALSPDAKDVQAALQAAREKRAARLAKKEERPPAPPAPEEPPKPAAPAESKAYLLRWQSAMARASAREFAEAIADLERAGAEISEEAAKRDSAADVEDLRRAQRARLETIAQIARIPAGQKLSLEIRGENGKTSRVEGPVVRAGASRIELQNQKESTAMVEWSDLTAASLAEQAPAGNARGLAILCLLDGDRTTAERALGEAPSALPARYWAYAAEAVAHPFQLPSREYEARRLFYPAEREWEKPETRAAAVGKYKTLIEDYTSTAVVKEDPARVRRRAESAQEYFLLSGTLKGSGQFAVAPAPKTDTAWIVKADAVGTDVALTFVDADFVAAQDLSYKCWVLVGGCCAETFLFYLQTTDGTIPDPKTGKTLFIEPGGGPAVPVKHGIQGLPKSHAAHKPKVPKSPLRWEWVAIPLPKYPAPGLKKIRLLSDQQGFGVAAVLVTSKRAAPLSEGDLKDAVARLKSPDDAPGAPAGGKPWRPVFDGKSDCLRPGSPGWRFEGTAIAHVSDVNNAAQTRDEFTDGELRIRFEVKDITQIYFKFRQGSGGGYAVILEDGLKALEGKPHELIFTAQGDQVTAALDGSPQKVVVEGASPKGCLQFNARGKTVNILAIDTR